MNEFHHNLWAPWRMEYIESLAGGEAPACFLCAYRDAPQRDAENLVLWRAGTCLALMNRFPYTNGHLLIAPAAHKGDLDDLTDAEMHDLWELTRRAKRVLQGVLSPQGFNIGLNFGRCAGAGLPDHLHVHVVPRWSGDTNFMAVTGGVRVVPEALDRLYEKLRSASAARQ